MHSHSLLRHIQKETIYKAKFRGKASVLIAVNKILKNVLRLPPLLFFFFFFYLVEEILQGQPQALSFNLQKHYSRVLLLINEV